MATPEPSKRQSRKRTKWTRQTGQKARAARREVRIEGDSLEAVRAHLAKAEELLACMPEMLVLGRIAGAKPRSGGVGDGDGEADAVAAAVGVVRWRIERAVRLLRLAAARQQVKGDSRKPTAER